MDLSAYHRYLEQFVIEAVQNSDGTNKSVSDYLWSKSVKGFLTRHRNEKQKALDEARKAFDEHRHWPVKIVLSYLGIKRPDEE